MTTSLKLKIYVLASPQKRGDSFQTLVFDKTKDINKTYSYRQNTRKKIANQHSYWWKQATLATLSGSEKTAELKKELNRQNVN